MASLKKIFAFLGVFGLILLKNSPAAQAMQIRSGETVDISSPVSEDLITAGGTINLGGIVSGDSIIFGGQVEISSFVEENLIVIGGNVKIDANVGNDLIILGGQVDINGTIGGDLIVAGGQISIATGSIIQEDLIIAGGDVKFKGLVSKDLKIYSGNLLFNGLAKSNAVFKTSSIQFNGIIEGDTEISATEELEIGEEAEVKGNLNYWTPKEQKSLEDKVVGKTTYTNDLKPQEKALKKNYSNMASNFIMNILRNALLIALFVWGLNRLFKRSAQYSIMNPWQSLGYGALYFLGTPVLSIILMFTVIGLPIGILLLIIYFFSLIFVSPLLFTVAARYYNQRFDKKWPEKTIFLVAVAGLTLAQALMIVPYLSILVFFILAAATTIAIGSTLAVVVSKVRNENKKG